MSRSRVPLALGLAGAGGVGWYLYSAGGSPKVAEKQFEADVHRASAKVKGELPGRASQAQVEAEKYGEIAGAKLDSAVNQTRAQFEKTKAETEAYAKEAKANAMKKVDEFDRKVETEAAKAKSGISSWFGGK